MCESLPIDASHPTRLGNELLCDDCIDGRCADCHSDGCEHACGWLHRLRVAPNTPRRAE